MTEIVLEELLYDGSLILVEYLLMALDVMLAGTHTFQNVSKEQVLAFLEERNQFVVLLFLARFHERINTDEQSQQTIHASLCSRGRLRWAASCLHGL